jgi:hypothetical protein
MTFTLISVVYACGVAKPGHGSFTPLAVGLSLVACAGTGALSKHSAWHAVSTQQLFEQHQPNNVHCRASLHAIVFRLRRPLYNGRLCPDPETLCVCCCVQVAASLVLP